MAPPILQALDEDSNPDANAALRNALDMRVWGMAVYMGRAPREATGIWILEASDRPGEAEWHGIRTNRRADIFVAGIPQYGDGNEETMRGFIIIPSAFLALWLGVIASLQTEADPPRAGCRPRPRQRPQERGVGSGAAGRSCGVCGAITHERASLSAQGPMRRGEEGRRPPIGRSDLDGGVAGVRGGEGARGSGLALEGGGTVAGAGVFYFTVPAASPIFCSPSPSATPPTPCSLVVVHSVLTRCVEVHPSAGGCLRTPYPTPRHPSSNHPPLLHSYRSGSAHPSPHRPPALHISTSLTSHHHHTHAQTHCSEGFSPTPATNTNAVGGGGGSGAGGGGGSPLDNAAADSPGSSGTGAFNDLFSMPAHTFIGDG
ncbi:hypothetical protein BJ912DRAFT_1065599 [Pholiota molesta]|nr:hypothetical protein BJ912DRAFT_1065599 [Pholiota molesta]